MIQRRKHQKAAVQSKGSKKPEGHMRSQRKKSPPLAKPPSPPQRLAGRRFQALFKGLPLCAVVFQKRGDEFVITEYNQAAVTFTKGAMPNYVGKTARELYGSRPDVLEGFSRAFEGRTTVQQSTDYRLLSTGEAKSLIMTFTYVPPDLVLLINEDVTDRKQADEKIRHLYAELETHVEERTAQLQSANLKLQHEITERRQMEQESAWLASFPKLNPIPIIEVDLAGSIHFKNPAAEQALPDLQAKGLEHPWLAGWESIGIEFRDLQRSSIQREVNVGGTWYLQSISYVPESQRIRIYGVNITKRKRAEEERERLVANLKQTTADAEYNRAQLEAVFQSVTDGIAVFDMSGNAIFVNEAEARINGFESAEAMKRNLAYFRETYEISFPDGTPVPFEEWPTGKVLRGESVRNWELRARRRDTRQEWFFSFNGEPVRHECGEQVLAVVITQDITERKIAEERLVSLNRDLERRAIELEKANKELESFSYSISHDLRTPLSAINGFSSLLLKDYEGSFPPDALQFLELIRSNSTEMNHLVEGLLSFSRFIREPIKKQPVDLGAIARQVVEDLHSQQEGRRCDILIADLPPGQADPVLIKQVLTNLLSNALKFTRRCDLARIEIGSSISEQGEVVYHVRDNGIGFDPTQAEKLFAVFQRLHSQDEFEGTGVGLAIVERIIRRHGGRVCAEGEVNHGATFYFTLA